MKQIPVEKHYFDLSAVGKIHKNGIFAHFVPINTKHEIYQDSRANRATFV